MGLESLNSAINRSKPKPEPAPESQAKPAQVEAPAKDEWNIPITNETENRNVAEVDGWGDPIKDNWNTTTEATQDGWKTTSDATVNESWNAVAESTTQDGWPQSETTKNDTSTDEKQDETKEAVQSAEVAETPAEKPAPEDKEPSPRVAPTKVKQPIGRRLKQDAPVVLPTSSTTLTSVDVKFGSLSLDDTAVESTETETRYVSVIDRCLS